MRDYPYVCGADIQSIANKEFVRFETAKSRDIVVALDKSNIPFSAKYNDTEIVLTYDGNYKDSVDEIAAKVMSEKYDELLREIREKKSDNYLLLLSEVADVLNTTVGTLKARPVEIQELLCKAYADFWICDTPTIQRELDRYITVNGRTLQDIQEYEKSKDQEKAPKAPEKSTAEPPTFEVLIANYQRRESHAGFTREKHKYLSEIARRRQQNEQEKTAQTEETERNCWHFRRCLCLSQLYCEKRHIAQFTACPYGYSAHSAFGDAPKRSIFKQQTNQQAMIKGAVAPNANSATAPFGRKQQNQNNTTIYSCYIG